MAFYIKVTKEVADEFKLTSIRNNTADGHVLLWQADIAAIPGETVFDRASAVGGVCLTPQQAKDEIDGSANPVMVKSPAYIPDEVYAADGEIVDTDKEEVQDE